jgi:hypothetical protein
MSQGLRWLIYLLLFLFFMEADLLSLQAPRRRPAWRQARRLALLSRHEPLVNNTEEMSV